jgi:hypothetical protein
MTADWVKPSLSKQLSVRFSLVVGSLYSPLDLCYMPTSQVYPDSSRLLALDNFCKPKGPRRALTPCRPPWTLSPGIYDLCSALLACLSPVQARLQTLEATNNTVSNYKRSVFCSACLPPVQARLQALEAIKNAALEAQQKAELDLARERNMWQVRVVNRC